MIAGSLAATAAVPTQVVMFGNDSRVVRSFSSGKKAYLLAINAVGHTTTGPISIKSPKFHDNVNGIYFPTINGTDLPLPMEFLQPLYSQDNLDILFVDTLGAGDWDNVALEIYYEEQLGNMGNYIMPDALKGKVANIVTVEMSHAVVGALGYQAGHNITLVTDLLKANTNYALLGYQTRGDQFCAGFMGPCTGNMRIMLPSIGMDQNEEANYFIRQSQRSGLPCIPVMNSADRYATFVDYLESVGGTADGVDLIFAELL